jgi:hypothetical protein
MNKVKKYPTDTILFSTISLTLLSKIDTSKKKISIVMQLTKKILCKEKQNSTLNIDSSSDKSLSKPDLQYRIKDKSI